MATSRKCAFDLYMTFSILNALLVHVLRVLVYIKILISLISLIAVVTNVCFKNFQSSTSRPCLLESCHLFSYHFCIYCSISLPSSGRIKLFCKAMGDCSLLRLLSQDDFIGNLLRN